MTEHYEFDNQDDLIPTWHLLTLLQKLKAVKFKRLDYQEHWVTYTLTIEYF